MWLKMNLGNVANADGEEREKLRRHSEWNTILKDNSSNCTSD